MAKNLTVLVDGRGFDHALRAFTKLVATEHIMYRYRIHRMFIPPSLQQHYRRQRKARKHRQQTAEKSRYYRLNSVEEMVSYI